MIKYVFVAFQFILFSFSYHIFCWEYFREDINFNILWSIITGMFLVNARPIEDLSNTNKALDFMTIWLEVCSYEQICDYKS